MKNTKILLVFLLVLILSSCGKFNNEKNDIFYGYEQESENITEQAPYTIDGQKVSSDSFEMHIPEDYSLTDNGSSLRIENENNSFDISIEEHKYSNENFEQFISESVEEYRQMGAEVSEPEAVTIGNYDMQQVIITFFPMQAYGYFVDQGDKAFLISLVSNEKEMSQDETDAFIEQACISF
ncbi:MAG: hypothetical protein IJT36_08845 [Alphaproteobacteria bacterium]|jgi:protein involved in sex pheromone biosynthesis|nr:hypothetical protein [Alphaproteobacteria bacterium]